jgi:hypothetical protein
MYTNCNAFPDDTPHSPTLEGTAGLATTNTEQVFTLFPKLPPELRLKIWKQALPGPRVVLFCIWDMLQGNRAEVARRCDSTNSLITITHVCQEARGVVLNTYDKLVNVIQPSLDIPRDQEEHPFVYVDYSKDTVYVEDWVGMEQLIGLYLSKAQHVAWQEVELRNYSTLSSWTVFKPACPVLKSLTFVGTWGVARHKLDEEWMLLDILASLDSPKTLPQPTWEETYDEEELVEALDNHGNLALLCAEAKEALEHFQEYAEEHTEWKDVTMKVAVLATKQIGSSPWSLFYWVDHINWIREMGPSNYIGHWHAEPVLLGDGTLVSCKPFLGNLPKNCLCGDCRTQRLLDSSDGFWLAEESEEDPEESVGSPVSGTDSSDAGEHGEDSRDF